MECFIYSNANIYIFFNNNTWLQHVWAIPECGCNTCTLKILFLEFIPLQCQKSRWHVAAKVHTCYTHDSNLWQQQILLPPPTFILSTVCPLFYSRTYCWFFFFFLLDTLNRGLKCSFLKRTAHGMHSRHNNDKKNTYTDRFLFAPGTNP